MTKLQPILENESPEGIGFAEGFMGPSRYIAEGSYRMMFSLKKAKQIVKKLEKDIRIIEGGLEGDWKYNRIAIYENKKWVKDGSWDEADFCGGSFWATPIIRIFYEDGTNECYECYEYDKTEKWEEPSDAFKFLGF